MIFPAIIPCAAQLNVSEDQSSRLSWTRGNESQMPDEYYLENGQLVFPNILPKFAGKYKCVVENLNGKRFISIIELKVEGL